MKTSKFIPSRNYNTNCPPSPKVLALKAQQRQVSMMVSMRNENTTTLRLAAAKWLSENGNNLLAGLLKSDYRHLIGQYLPTKWS